MRPLLLALVVALPLVAVLAEGPGPVRFVLLGDTGTGEAAQYEVAAAVGAVCAARGCDFAVIAGDNIYDSGVESPYDPQFDTKFEQPYAGLAMPFYLALGNHDESAFSDGLGEANTKGDHEIAYSHRTDRASSKWNMPARWYDVRVGDVHLVVIDSNVVLWSGLQVGDPLSAAQGEFVRDTLDASDARWKFVVGHHPYVSNGQHGNAGAYEGVPGFATWVKLWFEEYACGRADAILAGHDHDLQWLAPVPACGATEFLVSGAGAKSRPLADPARNAAHFQRGSSLGFAWLEADGDSLVGAFYDRNGARLYERALAKSP